MTKMIKENLIKNLFIIVLLLLCYLPIKKYLLSSNLVVETTGAGDVLAAVSILSVIACFGNFAFTYEKIRVSFSLERYLSHIVTGLLMLIIGISLMFTSVLVEILMGNFIIVDLSLIILYLACVGYDFWDVLKI